MGGQSGSGRFPPPRLTRDPTRRALLPSARPEPPRKPGARSRGPAPGSQPCSPLAQGRPAPPAGPRPPGSRGPQGAAARPHPKAPRVVAGAWLLLPRRKVTPGPAQQPQRERSQRLLPDAPRKSMTTIPAPRRKPRGLRGPAVPGLPCSLARALRAVERDGPGKTIPPVSRAARAGRALPGMSLLGPRLPPEGTAPGKCPPAPRFTQLMTWEVCLYYRCFYLLPAARLVVSTNRVPEVGEEQEGSSDCTRVVCEPCKYNCDP